MLRLNKTSKICIATAIVILLASVMVISISSKDQINHNPKSNKLNVNLYNIKLTNREKIIKDNTIYFGNNLKELENNFYDFGIKNESNICTMWLNKLWIEKYDDDYIEDNYLAQICREIDNNINFENKPEEFDYTLFKFIKENYMLIRKEKIESKLDLNTVSLKATLEDYIFKLEIEVI